MNKTKIDINSKYMNISSGSDCGVLIAGTNSGSGKTTITIALLSALKRRGYELSSFKCGPDYIDPMFHREVLGVPSYNLDPFFMSAEQLCVHFSSRSRGFSLIEGVMGYYDGVGVDGRFSTYDVARAVGVPVVLVVDGRGMSNSAGALISGFRNYRRPSQFLGLDAENEIRAVIFNNISRGMYPLMKRIAEDAGVISLGYFPKLAEARIESRHLGLITDFDRNELEKKIELLGDTAEECLDLDALAELASHCAGRRKLHLDSNAALRGVLPCGLHCGAADNSGADSFTGGIDNVSRGADKVSRGVTQPVIAVARDRAFCFIYQENLELLESLGAKLTFFSPMSDAVLPAADALYLPGGYPEAHLPILAENKTMLGSVSESIKSGMPAIAECGGFMYLHNSIDGVRMAGVIDGDAFRTEKLQRFGYTHISPERSGLIGHAGADIRCHEFHYYDSTAYGADFIARKERGGEAYPCAHHSRVLYAGFPHLYFPAHPEIAANFVSAALKFRAVSNNA